MASSVLTAQTVQETKPTPSSCSEAHVLPITTSPHPAASAAIPRGASPVRRLELWCGGASQHSLKERLCPGKRGGAQTAGCLLPGGAGIGLLMQPAEGEEGGGRGFHGFSAWRWAGGGLHRETHPPM